MSNVKHTELRKTVGGLTVIIASFIGNPVLAQQPTADLPASRLQLPVLSVGVGLGRVGDGDGVSGPLQTVTIQYHFRRNLALEGELSHWSTDRTSRFSSYYSRLSYRSWSTGVNLYYVTEPRLVTVFGGGGVSFASRNEDVRFSDSCPPSGACQPESNFTGSGTHTFSQAAVGANVRVRGPLQAYAAFQLSTNDGAYMRMTTGMRVVALTTTAASEAERAVVRARAPSLPPEQVIGREVRVTLGDGSRFSRQLVSFSDTELTLRKGSQDVRYPLDNVRLVERVKHTARRGALIGAGTGFLVGA